MNNYEHLLTFLAYCVAANSTIGCLILTLDLATVHSKQVKTVCPINLALGWRSVGLGPDLTGHFELLVHLAYILVVSCNTLMGAPARARCHCTEVQVVRWIHYNRCSKSTGPKSCISHLCGLNLTLARITLWPETFGT